MRSGKQTIRISSRTSRHPAVVHTCAYRCARSAEDLVWLVIRLTEFVCYTITQTRRSQESEE